MFKPQMKFQKISAIVLLIITAAVFLYAVGLSTDFYPLFLGEAYGYEGSEFFYDIQAYNKALVICSIVLIVISTFPFIFGSSSRRKYYIGNTVTLGIQAVSYVACSIFLFIETAQWKARFLNDIDLEVYIKHCQKKKWFFSGGTIWFDLGYVFAGILIACALVIVANYVWKRILMNREKNLLEGVVADGK